MSKPEKWKEMVKGSRDAIEDVNEFLIADDLLVIWADTQIRRYKKAMLALVRGNSRGWADTVTDDEEKLIEAMVRKAKAE